MQNNDGTQRKRLSGFKKGEIELMEKMFEHAPMAIGVLEGPEHRVKYLNKRFRYLYGLNTFKEGVPAKKILMEAKGNRGEALYRLELLSEVYNSGEPYMENEYSTYVGKTGKNKLDKAFFNMIFQPLKDEEESVYGVVIAGYEVTDQVMAREQRAVSERRLALALEGADMGFWEIDSSNEELVYISEQCKSHYGFHAQQTFTYQDLISAFHPEDREYISGVVNEAREEKKFYDLKFRVIWPDNSVHWLKVHGQWLYNDSGEPYRRIGISIDITRQKETERRLKEAIKLRDEFLSIASHELQTPVTSMKVRGELFERKLQEAGNKEYARDIRKINQRIDELSKLTGNLLEITRMREGKLMLEKGRFDLREVIDETVETLSHISNHQIHIHSPEHKVIYADRFRIGQVLTNLLENAIKYSPESDEIEIHLLEIEEGVEISVADYGIGISKKEQNRVFERFFKGRDKEKNTYPGFGIGLYISAQIIQRHGGTIRVTDNKPKGSVFTITLPDAMKNQ